jgi:hypothetical protein
MPTNRTRRSRARVIGPGGISEIDYLYFTFGDFFEAEGYTIGKSEADLKAFWLRHRREILERFYKENPLDRKPWPVEKWGIDSEKE